MFSKILIQIQIVQPGNDEPILKEKTKDKPCGIGEASMGVEAKYREDEVVRPTLKEGG